MRSCPSEWRVFSSTSSTGSLLPIPTGGVFDAASCEKSGCPAYRSPLAGKSRAETVGDTGAAGPGECAGSSNGGNGPSARSSTSDRFNGSSARGRSSLRFEFMSRAPLRVEIKLDKRRGVPCGGDHVMAVALAGSVRKPVSVFAPLGAVMRSECAKLLRVDLRNGEEATTSSPGSGQSRPSCAETTKTRNPAQR